MIIASMQDSVLYEGMGARLAAGLAYLRNRRFAGLPNGKHEIEGIDLYAVISEYNTKPQADGIWEAHRRYVDIQYLVSGEELVGYAPLDRLTVSKPYDPIGDCVFFKGAGDFLSLRVGFFAVLWPQDAHMPGITVSQPAAVKKVVMKVRV